ncbi:MAG TPA: pilus assembly protein N-terminal domain-containing protein [Alcaligenes sp.]|nr:pilus assembly protein N-terminal domain-containing protein [Alcaligenes sp.]HRL26016.1 pilus assembly protein N-terminal domain-containing protein [Alcaligenes sp.]
MNAMSCFIVLLGACVMVGLPAPVLAQELELQVGELLVLPDSQVERVAVGDGDIVHAMTTESRELILFARKAGRTAVQVWAESGSSRSYQVQVAPENHRQTLAELRELLGRIPQLRVSELGGKLVLEGEGLSDQDKERIQSLSQQHPQLLDFTQQDGWEPMVLLDVQVVEVPRNSLRELGVRWDGTSQGGMSMGLGWDAATHQFLERPGQAALPLPFPARQGAAFFGIGALMSARVQAMAQEGQAVVLAQPQLLARSGSQAEFLAGGELPYTVTDAKGNSNTTFKPYGVSLRIVPRVERGGLVRSRIEVEVSAVDASQSQPSGPSLKTRRASTEFNVRSGQTLVLAGFISREQSRHLDRLPGLADIPVLGALFRSERFARHETELAVFVTPTLVDADHPDFLARQANSAQWLEQAFPEPPRLNTPVRADHPGHAASRPDITSQWSLSDSEVHRVQP